MIEGGKSQQDIIKYLRGLGFVSVSYTHLDVYKRQRLYGGMFRETIKKKRSKLIHRRLGSISESLTPYPPVTDEKYPCQDEGNG